MLLKNGYPAKFIDTISQEFIDTISQEFTDHHHNTSQELTDHHYNTSTNINQDDSCTQNKQAVAYLTIPYVGKPSITLQNTIRKELKKCNLDIMAAYNTTKVGTYYKLKPPCPKLFLSNVVYQNPAVAMITPPTLVVIIYYNITKY